MPKSKIVAIVDDDAAVLSAIGSLVRSIGLAALTFSSGEALLESSDLSRCGCLISDLHMPGGMNGFELQQALVVRHLTMPVVLMTGLLDETSHKRALGSGAVAVMQKPIDSDLLVACLEEACGDGEPAQ